MGKGSSRLLTPQTALTTPASLVASACVGLLLSACTSTPPVHTADNISDQCFVNAESQPPTRTCRILNFSRWAELGLTASDQKSLTILKNLNRHVQNREDNRNFYPSFVNVSETDYPFIIRDDEGWLLQEVLESSADKNVCSHVRAVNEWLKESGDGEQNPDRDVKEDKKHGNRCGNISIIHSLVRLGVLSEENAYRGEYLNPDLVTLLDRYHGSEPGMTPAQQRRGYMHFNNERRQLNCNATLPASVSKRGEVVRLARTLRTNMNSTKPLYDCSLSVHADKQNDGSAGIRHVEHVTAVRELSDGEYLIDTLDGFHQGSGAADIPKTPATNTWSVGSGNGSDWIQLKDSSLESNKRNYSEIPPYWIEMRCCSVVER